MEALLTRLIIRRDSLLARLETMAADDPERTELESMITRLDLMLSPAVPSPKAMRKLVQAQEDMDNGTLVASIPYDKGRELRVFVKHEHDRCEVCMKLYHLHRGIRQMVPTRHGMAVNALALPGLVDALTHARQYVPTKRIEL